MRETILNKIYDLLIAIDGIEEVYKYQKSHFEKYPVAVILGSEIENERSSVKTIKKTYTFRVQILQEINEEARGSVAGEEILIRLSDLVETAFDNDDTLGCSCDDVNVASSFVWEDRELMMRVLELNITCLKLKQLT